MAEKPAPAGAPQPAREVSAGGVVLRENEVLLVKVRNLQGEVVWTFPKGHLEAGETARQAALREVKEETGWTCRVDRPFTQVHYRFSRQGRLVQKTVHWFLMSPLSLDGESDPREILDCRWFPLREAADLVVYKSDRQIMARLRKKAVRR